MSVKQTDIYKVYEFLFSSIDMRDWKRLMQKSLGKYLKKGLTKQQAIGRLEIQYMNILMDVVLKHPESISDPQKVEQIKAWMHSKESLIKKESSNEEE